MKNLLKADFKRVLQDKLLLIMGIIAVAFAVVMPLLYAAIFSGAGMKDDPLLSMYISGKVQFFDALSIGNNMGLIAPIFLGITLFKDFSYGTIRNKIIAGKSRRSIFLSMYITCAVVFVAVMLFHAFITLGISLIFFDYQATAFTLADFWYFLASLGFELLVLLWVASLLSWLCASAKNVGLVIVLFFAFSFGLSLIGGILQIVIPVLEVYGSNENLIDVLYFIDRINIGSSAMYIGTGTAYTLEDVLYLTLSPLVGILGFTWLGLRRFNKRDLK